MSDPKGHVLLHHGVLIYRQQTADLGLLGGKTQTSLQGLQTQTRLT